MQKQRNVMIVGFAFLMALGLPGWVTKQQDLFFACTVADTAALSAHDDASECLWIPLAQVRPLDFGLQSVRRGVERFLSATHFADGQPFVDGQEGQKT